MPSRFFIIRLDSINSAFQRTAVKAAVKLGRTLPFAPNGLQYEVYLRESGETEAGQDAKRETIVIEERTFAATDATVSYFKERLHLSRRQPRVDR